MTIIASPLATSQDAIPIVSATQIGKFAGLHMHFPTIAAFQAAVLAEQGNVTASSALWADKQTMTVSGEPSSAYRLWSTSAGNARTVHLRPGLTVTLAADSNVVLAATGAPSSGTGNNGDISIDFAGNVVYLKASGAWAVSVPAIFAVVSDNSKISFAAPFNAATNVVSGVAGLTSLANSSPGAQTTFQNTAAGTTTGISYLGSITSLNFQDQILWNGLIGAWSVLPFNAPSSVGVFTTAAALQTAFPAALWAGYKGLVGSAAPFKSYASDGVSWVYVAPSATSLSGVTYDGSSRVTAYTLNAIAYVVAYPNSTTITVTGNGQVKTISLDVSGRITGLSVA